MELLACAPINIISRGGREGKSRGEGGVLSGAHLQTSLSLILRLLPKAAIGKLKMQEGLGWCVAMNRISTFTYFAQTLVTEMIRVKLSTNLV